MKRIFSKWDSFELPQLTERDYGINWPAGTAQVSKELLCFKVCRMGNKMPGMQPPLIHFLNIMRMLYPHMVELYKDVPKGRIWNNYYLDVADELCDFNGTGQDRTVFTGPASANKTYGVASFMVGSFFSAPGETLGMVSTTSGSASERRIWADIKDFQREAKYEECGITPIGEIIENLKSIVFDPSKQLGDSKVNHRDFRDGIQVIPIASDSSGEAALSTIQGSKNKFVMWALDEMAQMNPGVTRPSGNLSQNPHYHFIGIGNANDENDPHAKACTPVAGLKSLDIDVDRRWESATGNKVCFLHGDESPNNHPYIDQSLIKKVTDYPFPYASNPLSSAISAKEYGHGNVEDGKQTVDYWKFCIGFWPASTASNSLYTKSLFEAYNALIEGPTIVAGKRDFGAADFAFSTGGDSNSFMHAVFGFDANGRKTVTFDSDTKAIRSRATEKGEFTKQVAGLYVDEIRAHGINYKDFGADTGNDASLTFTEMCKLTGSYDLVGISSIGKPLDEKKYQNKVTELWFWARDLIKTGCVRGINPQAKYYTQLIQRKYQAIGRNFYQIERKRDMKKRIGRSPDDADTFIYLCYMIRKSGLFDAEIAAVKEVKTAEDELDEARARAARRRDPRDRVKQEEESEEFQLTEMGSGMSDYASLF